MSIELDGINLVREVRDTDTGVTTLLHTVYNIDVSDKRSIVEHNIPGLKGAILQDLGRELVRISFEGLIFGEDAVEFLERIRSKYKGGEPLPFSSDISNAADVTQILIEELEVAKVGGAPATYWYWMILREYIPPPEEEETAPSQEGTVQEQAQINYITGRVEDADGNPVSGVDVKITWDGGEYVVQTNEEGNYRQDDLEPGTYTVTIDASDYEDQEETVVIR